MPFVPDAFLWFFVNRRVCVTTSACAADSITCVAWKQGLRELWLRPSCSPSCSANISFSTRDGTVPCSSGWTHSTKVGFRHFPSDKIGLPLADSGCWLWLLSPNQPKKRLLSTFVLGGFPRNFNALLPLTRSTSLDLRNHTSRSFWGRPMTLFCTIIHSVEWHWPLAFPSRVIVPQLRALNRIWVWLFYFDAGKPFCMR